MKKANKRHARYVIRRNFFTSVYAKLGGHYTHPLGISLQFLPPSLPQLDAVSNATFNNLTTWTPSPPLTRLLVAGIKFCPRPPFTTNEELLAATNRTCRRLLLHDWFTLQQNEPHDKDYDYRLRLRPSKWEPSLQHCKLTQPLRNRIRAITAAAKYWESRAANFIPPRRHADYKLLTHGIPPNVFFTAADKNFGLTALHLDAYDAMTRLHLENTRNYQMLCDDALQQTLKQIRQQHHDLLGVAYDELGNKSQVYKFLCETEFNIPKFHVLPKLHKVAPTLWNATAAQNIPSRPIAGATSWITTKWSQWLGTILEAIPTPCVIKDSFTFIKKLPATFTPARRAFLFSGDADSLYPNVQIPRLLEILQPLLATLPWEAARFILKSSLVQYRNRVFKQLSGLPMGTNAAVMLANIYLSRILDDGINSHPDIAFYVRYIDDCFGIVYADSLASAEQTLRQQLDSAPLQLHWNFEFSAIDDNGDSASIHFLDVNIQLKQFAVHTATYIKPTNLSLYIMPHSCHPRACLRGFIYGEQVRFLRLSSTREAYDVTCLWFIRALRRRGYAAKFLASIARPPWEQRASCFNKDNASTTTALATNSAPAAQMKKIPFVIRYSNRPILNTLRASLSKLNDDPAVQKLKVQVLTAYCAPPNIGRFLIKSGISKIQEQLLPPWPTTRKRHNDSPTACNAKRTCNPNDVR